MRELNTLSFLNNTSGQNKTLTRDLNAIVNWDICTDDEYIMIDLKIRIYPVLVIGLHKMKLIGDSNVIVN